jgi:hypothetical protein
MAKTLTIEAKTRTGERGFVEVECPENLAEMVQMFGERETFKMALSTKVIEWQREARPVAADGNSDQAKPKKRLSVFDRLSQS